MGDGSEVHAYLESELGEYYYRDENSLIRATPEAAELVDAGPDTVDGRRVVQVPRLQARVIEVVAGPEERSESVVAVLHELRNAGLDPEVDAVRSALGNLVDRGILERIRRTVPTYRLAVDRDDLEVRNLDD